MKHLKKLLSVLAALCLLCSLCTLAFAEGETEEEESIFVIGETELVVGSNRLTLADNTKITVFEFVPTQSGIYRFSTNSSAAKLYTVDGSLYYMFNQVEQTSKRFEKEIKESVVGTPVLVGIMARGNVALKIERVSDAGFDMNAVEYTTYQPTATLSPFTKPANTTLTFVDVKKSHTAVRDDSGNYHLDTVDGPLLYIDLASAPYISLSAAASNGNMKVTIPDEDGVQDADTIVNPDTNEMWKKIEFITCINKYYGYTNNQNGQWINGYTDGGIYPLTDDMVYVMQTCTNFYRWNDIDSPNYLFKGADETKFAVDTGTAWMFPVCYDAEQLSGGNEGDETEDDEQSGTTPPSADAPNATTLIGFDEADALSKVDLGYMGDGTLSIVDYDGSKALQYTGGTWGFPTITLYNKAQAGATAIALKVKAPVGTGWDVLLHEQDVNGNTTEAYALKANGTVTLVDASGTATQQTIPNAINYQINLFPNGFEGWVVLTADSLERNTSWGNNGNVLDFASVGKIEMHWETNGANIVDDIIAITDVNAFLATFGGNQGGNTGGEGGNPGGEDSGEPDPNPTPDATLSIGSAIGRPGDTVTLTFAIENAPAIKSMALTGFTYDSDKLEILSGEWAELGSIINHWDGAKESAAIAFVDNTDLNGAVFTLTLRIKEGVSFETLPVSCRVVAKTMEGDSEVALPMTVTAGSVQVGIPGDADGDLVLDTNDAIYLLYYTLLPDLYPITQDGDMDGNGEVNSNDAIYLLYHVLLPEQYPLG